MDRETPQRDIRAVKVGVALLNLLQNADHTIRLIAMPNIDDGEVKKLQSLVKSKRECFEMSAEIGEMTMQRLLGSELWQSVPAKSLVKTLHKWGSLPHKHT